MASPPRIIVLGSVNTDLVIRGKRLPRPGETVLGGTFFQAAGGKGANQAVAAARLARQPVVLLAAVGDDSFGQSALTALNRENLSIQYVRIVAGTASGVALIVVDELGENAISVASGANASLLPSDVDALPDELLSFAGVFMTCLESPLETVEHGLQRAKAAGMLTILNPAPADNRICRPGLLRLVDVLTPNENEAAALAEVSVSDDASAVAAAQRLQSLGCRAVIITRGAQGCLVVKNDEITRIPAPVVQAIDTTAAGDAFNGALAVALSEGQPLAIAAHFASTAAAISVTRQGAQPSLPTRREVEDCHVERRVRNAARILHGRCECTFLKDEGTQACRPRNFLCRR
ncbi:MAG: ribokinase, partial [Pirellulales bacterium]